MRRILEQCQGVVAGGRSAVVIIGEGGIRETWGVFAGMSLAVMLPVNSQFGWSTKKLSGDI